MVNSCKTSNFFPKLASSSLSVSGSLDRLSNEVIDEIISYLLPPKEHCRSVSKQDTLAFGLASQRLWNLVLRHVHISNINTAAPWAGKKICYQSSFSSDLSAPFEQDNLTKQILGPGCHSGLQHGRRFWYRQNACPMPVMVKREQTIWIQAIVQAMGIKQMTPEPMTAEADKKQKMNPEELESRATQAKYAILEKQIRGPDLFPQNRVWVLRTLTSREVVFSEEQAPSTFLSLRSRTKRMKIEKETGEYFNFLVLVKIAWSEKGRGHIYLGKWAGHRLDIVEKSIHGEEGGQWKDITKKVEEEFRQSRKWLRI